MTREPTRNSLFNVVPLIAILVLSVALVTLAQMTRPGQRSAQHAVASAQLDTGSPAIRSQKNKAGAVPMDQNPPLFLPAVTYEAYGALSVAVADVNGDGYLDVVVVNATGDIGVLLGNGDGTFQPVVWYSCGGNQTPSIAIADVNGDGKPDLVVAQGNCTNCGGLALLMGNGDGTFQPPVYLYSGGWWTYSVAVADVNGDHIPDLVVTNTFASQDGGPSVVGVLLGNGAGTFQAPVTYNTGGYWADSVAVADVNGDGHPDLVVANSCQSSTNCNNGTVGILLGVGDGTFQAPVSYGSGGLYPGSVAVGDVDGNGHPDLVVANLCQSLNSYGTCVAPGEVSVLLGNGDGTFQAPVSNSSGGFEAKSVVISDVNGDGHPDLVVSNVCQSLGADSFCLGDGVVGVLLGNGDGTFQAAINSDSGGTDTTSLAVGDVNGDGLPDLVVTNATSATVGVLLHVGDIPTTTTEVSSPNPSAFNQAVTLTGIVRSSSGSPAGTVIFYKGSTALGSATLANGSGSISLSSLAVGSHLITATYQGSLKFNSSASGPLTQVVAIANTTTSIVPSKNPVLLSRPVKYTATVTGQYGGAVTGSVIFEDGGVAVATETLANNKASFSTLYQTRGSHRITATYSGDSNYAGSISATLVEQVGGFASKTVAATSGSPSQLGQPVMFTATITSTREAIPDGELVTFFDGTTAIGTGATSGGVATFATSSLTAKTHTIKANYAGDDTLEPSTGWVKQVVDKHSTTTALSSSLNPSNYGQVVIFIATVTSAGPTPTGKVTFKDGATTIGTTALSAGVATLTKSKLAVGTHPITAEYLGDADNAKSTSPVLDQVVQ